MDELLLIPIGLPILAGVVLLLSSFLECRRGVGTIGVGKCHRNICGPGIDCRLAGGRRSQAVFSAKRNPGLFSCG